LEAAALTALPFFLKELPAPVKPPSNSDIGRPYDLSDLRTGEPLQLPQHHDGAKMRGQGVEALTHLADCLSSDHAGAGILNALVNELWLLPLFAVKDPSPRDDPSLPQMIDREIRHDPMQPGREGIAKVKAFDAAKDAKKGFLSDIPGVLFIRKQAARDPVSAHLMSPDEPSEGLLIALLGAADPALLLSSSASLLIYDLTLAGR
jgi:hypothetical protein